MASGIYIITCNANGDFYGGSTKNFDSRWSGHLRRLRQNVHSNRHLQNWWNQYGETAFSYRPLIICSITDLEFYEQRWIDIHFGKPHCINISKDVRCPTRGRHFIFSEDHCRNTSKSLVGRHIPAETRRKLSIIQTGRPSGNKGRKWSLDERKRQSDRKKGQPSPRKGTTLNADIRKKISESTSKSITEWWTRRKAQLMEVA